MPIFDFECRKCGHKFDLMISNSEKDKAKCPQCGEMNLKQLLSSFSTASPARAGQIPEACSGCGAAGGGG